MFAESVGSVIYGFVMYMTLVRARAIGVKEKTNKRRSRGRTLKVAVQVQAGFKFTRGVRFLSLSL